MARDLKDAWGWLERLIRRVDRLEAGGMLENSSITGGRMRFIGGLLRLDSGARLEVVGTASISGPLSITGDLTVTGTASIEGPLTIKGATSITGNLTVTGTASIEGPLTIKGVTTVEGDLAVKKTLDVTATTRLRAKTTVESDLELTNSGSIKAGAIVIDPLGTNNGRISGGSVFDIIAGGMIRLLSNVTISGYIVLNGITPQQKAGISPGGLWIDPSSRRVYFAPVT